LLDATQLALVLGDLHVPTRARDLPDKFKKLLLPNKIHHILCTGNLGSKQQQEYLNRIAPNFHQVRGDFDKDPNLAEKKNCSNWKF